MQANPLNNLHKISQVTVQNLAALDHAVANLLDK